VQNHTNLSWSIEGGRTRTGKLRPPVYGILRYITDAVDEIDGPEVYLVPTSIVYAVGDVDVLMECFGAGLDETLAVGKSAHGAER
jgi:glycerol-3-phosphate O-acyltransferase